MGKDVEGNGCGAILGTIPSPASKEDRLKPWKTCQNSRRQGRDLNPRLHENEARMLITRLKRSVISEYPSERCKEPRRDWN